jgi:hypothetical protein
VIIQAGASILSENNTRINCIWNNQVNLEVVISVSKEHIASMFRLKFVLKFTKENGKQCRGGVYRAEININFYSLKLQTGVNSLICLSVVKCINVLY